MGQRRVKKTLKHKPYLRFKAVLVERGITQKEIAKLLNLSPVTISQKINGNLDFTYSEVEKICDELSISSEIFRTQKVA